MKKIIKIISILSMFLILSSIVMPVFAYNRSDYAFTMGCVEYDGTDTSVISERANYWYGTAGGGNKICYGLTTPDFNMLKNGAFVNGPRLLESGVIFLCGHASFDSMEWLDSEGKSAYINMNTSASNAVSLTDVNLKGTSLVTFAGCNTASGSGLNLTVQAVNKGATAALGWQTTVHISSLKNWADRYNQKLSQGNTLMDSALYANGYIYVWDDVKNCAYAGNANVQIKNPSKSNSMSEVDLSQKVSQLEINNNVTNFDDGVDIARLEKIIKEQYETFNEKDYEINVHKLDESNYTVDFIYKIDNIQTDMGFVVIVSDGKLLQINNFMNESSIEILKEKIEKNDLKSQDFSNLEEKINIECRKGEKVSIEKGRGKYIFSSEDNKLYYVASIVSEVDGGRLLDEFKQEID